MEPHRFYDLLYSRLYDRMGPPQRARQRVVRDLSLPLGSAVLEVGCGTGSNFPYLVEAVGPEGRIVGLDYSQGMLRRAASRVGRNGWRSVTLIHEDARNITAVLLKERAGITQVDGLLFSLVLSVVPEWDTVFDRAFSLLRSGGRCVIWDTKTVEGPLRILNPPWGLWNKLTAAADTRRPTWKLLDRRVADREVSYWLRGFVFIASGTKPRAPSTAFTPPAA